MVVPWTLKYTPQSAKEIPHPTVIEQLSSFVNTFKKQKKNAVFLYGPSGTGKTTAVHSLAKDMDLELVEVNASDDRDKQSIQTILGGSSRQMSLFGSGKLILIDEVDGLSGREDRGGATAIADIIAKSKFPIVLTANDPWDKKLSPLRSKSILVEMGSVNYLSIAKLLQQICEKEGVKYDEMALKSLARRAGGDIRSAINDLQTVSGVKKELTKDSLDLISDRDRDETMFNALTRVLKNSDANLAVSAFDNVKEDLDGCFLWVDENLPKEYKNPKDLARAYEAMAKADVYRGRIRRRMHWRFLAYVNNLLSAGVAVAKDQKPSGFVKYSPTMRILKIWQANMKYQKRKAIAQKIAEVSHTSKKEAIKSLPYIQQIFKAKHSSAQAIADDCDLDPEEVAWLEK